jgi:phage-related minor tail protein
MNKARLVTIFLAILLLAPGLNAYAQQDLASQVTALEQKAKIIQTQMDQAKSSNETSMNQQVQHLKHSVDALIKQRVAVDAQIAQLEAQIEDVTKKSQDTLGRQLKEYGNDLQKVKSQLAGILVEQKKNPQTGQPAAQVQAPAPQANPAAVAPVPVPGGN